MSVELDGNVRPISYNVTILPNMSWGESQPPTTMDCRMTMSWEAQEPTNHLMVHCCDIIFQDIEVEIEGKVIEIGDLTLLSDKPRELVRIEFNLISGTSGILRTKHTAQLRGLTSKGGVCVSQQNSTPVMMTHFEPLCARSLIPCFDFPSMKARFQLTVIKEHIPSHYKILSNTPVQEDSRSHVVFEQTTPICTYLFAFVIADLHSISTISSSGITLSVYTPRTRNIEDGRQSLQILQKTISFFEQYFDLRLEMSKLDIIGIPVLPAIAMENHCCLVFRLNYLLISEGTPLSRFQRIVRLIAHEVCHHWFGNSTSLDSWDSVWLKEGFARYLEYLCTDSLFPKWGFWGDFQIAVVEEMKIGDCVDVHRRPLEVHAPTVSAVMRLFDKVCYAKGASLTRMIKGIMGESSFRESISSFLKTTVNGTGSPNDLFSIFDSHVASSPPIPNMTISQWFEPWRNQESLPLVCIRESNRTEIAILTMRHPDILRCEDGVVASVFPVFITFQICIKKSEGLVVVRSEQILLPPHSTNEIIISIPELQDGNCLVIANTEAITYCRCLYDDNLTNRIMSNFSSLSDLTRLNVVLDASALLHVGTMVGERKQLLKMYLPSGIDPLFKVFQAVGASSETDNFIINATAAAAIDLLVKGCLCSNKVQSFIRGAFEHLLPEIERVAYSDLVVSEFGSFDKKKQLTPETAAMVLQSLGFCGSQSAMKLSGELQLELVRRMTETTTTDNPTFLIVAMAAVKTKVLHGGLDDWGVAWSVYQWAQTTAINEPDPDTDQGEMGTLDNIVSPPFPTTTFPLVGSLPVGYNLLNVALETLCLSKTPAVNDFIVSLILEDSRLTIDGAHFSLALGLLINYTAISALLPRVVKTV